MPAKKAKKKSSKKTAKVRAKKAAKKPAKKKITARKSKKKPGKKKTAVKSGPPAKQVIGVVTHYFPKVEAAVIKLKKPISVGDSILIKGKTTQFEQEVESMQIDRAPIQTAKAGDEIGLQVKERVREHDYVLLPS